MVLAFLFFCAAVLYSSVGHAGASGYLAAMAFLGTAPESMKPTALLLNILVASIATLRFYRAGHFDGRLLLPFALGSIPAAFVGGAFALPGRAYKVAVGLVLLLAAVQLLRSPSRKHPGESEAAERRVPSLAAVAWGGLIGLLAGLTGTGGGIFLSPLLLFLGWAETRRTAGVSAAFILLNSLAGLGGNAISFASLPDTSLLALWLVVVGVGGFIGSTLGSRRLSTPVLRRLLGVVLVVAAAKLFAG